MKRTITKILCAILVCVMVASTMPVFSYAMVADEDVTKITYIANTTTGVKINYTKVGEGSSYTVYRKSPDADFAPIAETRSTTYLDKTAQNGETYTYIVTVSESNANNFLGSSEIGDVTDDGSATIEYVSAPKFKLENTDIGVKVSITPVEGATSYNVKRNVNGKGLYVKVGEVPASEAPSFVDTSVENGVTYSYIVTASIDDAFSYYYSAKITAEVAPQMPDDMKTGITYIANTTVGVKLVFNKVDGVDEYNIYRKAGKGNFELIDTTLNTTFIDKTVENGVTYTYSVAIPGYSYNKNTRTITFVSAPRFTLSNGGLGVRVDIKPVEFATGYTVKRLGADGQYIKVGSVAPSEAPYFVDRSVESGVTYTYYVTANIGSAMSHYYISKFTPILAPKTKLTNVQTGVKVAYDKVANASKYNVYRRTADSDWTLIGSMKPTSYNYYIDKTAQSGTDYFYSIEIVTPEGNSGYDEIGTGIYYLQSPAVSVSGKNSGVVVNFTQARGAQSYQILRKLPGTSSFKKIATVSADATSYFDASGVAGATYAVRAANGSAISYMNNATYSPAINFITTVFSLFTSIFVK